MSNADLKNKDNGATVSVIIPTYQREEAIGRAIASVLAQRGIGKASIEIVVIDDGSKDKTEATVKAIAVSAPHRIVYEKIAHIGQPGLVRNHAIARSTGEYIGYCDSDDIWLPHHLATCLRQFELHPDCVMVETWWSFQRREKSFNRWKIEYQPAFTDGRTTTTNSRLHRRDALVQAGLFGSLKWGEDIDLWNRIGFVGPIRRVKIPTTAHAYTRSGDNITYEFCPDIARAYDAGNGPITAPAEKESTAWRDYFMETIAKQIETIAKQNVDLDKFRNYMHELATWRDHLTETIAKQNVELDKFRNYMHELERVIEIGASEISERRVAMETLQRDLAAAEHLQQSLNAVLASTSWRITHPLRIVMFGAGAIHRKVRGLASGRTALQGPAAAGSARTPVVSAAETPTAPLVNKAGSPGALFRAEDIVPDTVAPAGQSTQREGAEPDASESAAEDRGSGYAIADKTESNAAPDSTSTSGIVRSVKP